MWLRRGALRTGAEREGRLAGSLLSAGPHAGEPGCRADRGRPGPEGLLVLPGRGQVNSTTWSKQGRAWSGGDTERATDPSCCVGYVGGIGDLPECHPSRFKWMREASVRSRGDECRWSCEIRGPWSRGNGMQVSAWGERLSHDYVFRLMGMARVKNCW